MKELKEYFIEARNKAGMNQKELAEKSGVQKCTISRYENGKQDISIQTMLKICKVLNNKKLFKTIAKHINETFSVG